jgi:hypothetical protein
MIPNTTSSNQPTDGGMLSANELQLLRWHRTLTPDLKLLAVDVMTAFVETPAEWVMLVETMKSGDPAQLKLAEQWLSYILHSETPAPSMLHTDFTRRKTFKQIMALEVVQ